MDPDKIAKLRAQREELATERYWITYPTGSASTEEERANLARVDKLMAGIDAALEAEVGGASAAAGPGIKQGTVTKPIVWSGTKRAWGDWILQAYRAGSMPEATDPTKALRLAAQHYLWKDPSKPNDPPKPFKPKNVLANLKNRDDYQNPKKPAPR